MWLKWLPWKIVTKRLAQSHGFLDPIVLLGYLRRFSQPSEVTEPIELLRAGVVFHARGLINSRAIQHNLDWVWPYWVDRQFDPRDVSFIPRAFSATHINLTHRNWTAVGVPDFDELPIVDPRGLVTPLLDQWSIDGWILMENGTLHAPSQSEDCHQTFNFDENVHVVTKSQTKSVSLRSTVSVECGKKGLECRIHYDGEANCKGWLIIALRPFNPEGVSFIHRVNLNDGHLGWEIEGVPKVSFSDRAEKYSISDYGEGDVALGIETPNSRTSGVCDVGMISAAALYSLTPNEKRRVTVSVPLEKHGQSVKSDYESPDELWDKSLAGACWLCIPDEKMRFLYDAAIRTLILHTPNDVYPGPYTYKRFWFRDAAFIVHSLLLVGLVDRAEKILDLFPSRQTAKGFFHSQNGEWDSNGEALWIMHRYCLLTGRPPKKEWIPSIRKGARWILSKRLPKNKDDVHAGLLPAGFSAEHLGPNDFYFWDDFWAVAGLEAAAVMLNQVGDEKEGARAKQGAVDLISCIDTSVKKAAQRLGRPAMPAAPTRRLDTGAIGSLVAGYPLQLVEPNDMRLLDTAEFLQETSIVGGGFFHDMIHSGINPYLTLHIAQVMLRAGDSRYECLMNTVAELATSTGQWPEAIHPATKGGCMGDGQHSWASAEWIAMIRNCFAMEELSSNHLVIGAGIPAAWLTPDNHLFLGPTPTMWGDVSISIDTSEEHLDVRCEGDWFSSTPLIEIRLKDTPHTILKDGESHIRLERELVP